MVLDPITINTEATLEVISKYNESTAALPNEEARLA